MVSLSGRALSDLDPELLERANAAAVRLAAGDPTLWGPAAEAEARIRMGWLNLPHTSRALLDPLTALSKEFGDKSRIVLCGMGGSSLAPEVIAASAGVDLIVVDTTDAAQVSQAVADLAHTTVIVASKSGSTLETEAQRAFFTEAFRAAQLDPRAHMVIITDPGSPLDRQSRDDGFRVINADPHTGGRYSALSAFGLTPTALLGLDPSALLDAAETAHEEFLQPNSSAVILATAMAQHDTMTLTTTDLSLPGLGDWIEQLVAESTGKNGKGILPVVVESEASVDFLTNGLSVALGDSSIADLAVQAPLGAQFLLWEWATALASYLIEVDPFNQPNVTESKINTSALLETWSGSLPAIVPDAIEGNIEIFGASDLKGALRSLAPCGYLAILAYLDRGMDAEIATIRARLAHHLIQSGSPAPVTFGWGPRYLHSTGQFHKGGPDVGAFLVITGSPAVIAQIPGAPYDFTTVQMAQALGDVDALTARGRPVVRLHLQNRREGIEHLLSVALAL